MDVPLVTAIVVIVVAAILLAMVAAAEAALEQASDVRIRALASRDDVRAKRIAGDVENPRQFVGPLTAARVTTSTIVVAVFAYVGAKEYAPFVGAVGLGCAGGVLTAFLQMTVGLIVARQPEYAALKLSGLVRTTNIVFAIPALILGLPARVVARWVRAVTPDFDSDILSLVEREEAAGGVEEQERRMIRGIIALEDKTAREIMVPRIDMSAVDVEDGISEVAAIVNERGFSRVPVYRENIDDIIGIIYAKDVLRAMSNGEARPSLADLVREPAFIPESKRLDELLTEMQTTHSHMAIVVDEYGGTAGLVTIEDLLEEIVGEIEDEYDVARPAMEVISPDEVVLDAGMDTDILKELFGFEVDSDDFDTVGGFLIHELGRLPVVGDEVTADGLTMRVLSMSGRRVRRLRIARQGDVAAEEAVAR
ncbi:MAG TPA: hemolysin family protein [Tepidiformaceae bacterium]|nr:hemolysin family protein [Tepidiformaceae bacterium]